MKLDKNDRHSDDSIYGKIYSFLGDVCAEFSALECFDNDIVLVCGDTGSGKSTMINYLSNVRLKAVNSKHSWLNDLVLECEGKELAVIGHNTESQTSVPKRYVYDDLVLWDCPGFEDNRSAVQDMVNAFGITKIRLKAKNFKILAVIEEAALLEKRSNDFRDMMVKLDKMFERNPALQDSVVLCFTKCEQIEDYADYLLSEVTTKDYLDEYQKSFINNIILNNKFVCMPKPTEEGDYSSEYRDSVIKHLGASSPMVEPKLHPVIADKYLRYVDHVVDGAHDDLSMQLEKFFSLAAKQVDCKNRGSSIKFVKSLYKIKNECENFDSFIEKFKSKIIVNNDPDLLEILGRIDFIFSEIINNLLSHSGNSRKLHVQNLLDENLECFTRKFLSSFLSESECDELINIASDENFILEKIGSISLNHSTSVDGAGEYTSANQFFTAAVNMSKLHKYDEALNYSNDGIMISKSSKLSSKLYDMKGNIFYKLGKYEEAKKCYNTALLYNPDNRIALHNRGNLSIDFKNYDEAVRDFDEALELSHGNYAKAHYGKGTALYYKGLYSDALACYDFALRDDHKLLKANNAKSVVIKKLNKINIHHAHHYSHYNEKSDHLDMHSDNVELKDKLVGNLNVSLDYD